MSDIPPPTPILALIDGFRHSKVLFTAVDLGIFSILRNHSNGLTASQLADSISTRFSQTCSLDGLTRLLRALVSLDLLSIDSLSNVPEDLFSLNPISTAYLDPDSPYSLAGYITHSNNLLYPVWSDLEYSVLTGQNTWSKTGPSNSVFEQLYAGPDGLSRFMKGMDSIMKVSVPVILDRLDLSWVQTFADLGGGSGYFASCILEKYPYARGIVVDLEKVIHSAKTLVPHKFLDQGRITLVSCDFLKAPHDIPLGNAYILSRILHDWDDKTVIALLNNLFTSLPTPASSTQKAGIIIYDMILDPGKCSPLTATMQDINMLIQTSGRERTFEEVRQMLESAGFVDVQEIRTGKPLDVVVAFKK